MKQKTASDILSELPKYLSTSRLEHSKRVSECAQSLAAHWKENEDSAKLAGLGHDIAKELSPKDEISKHLNIPNEINTLYKKYPAIWHAFAAPIFLEKLFNITAAEIQSAAQWHCTGTAEMTPLEQIVFIADYIEPERDFSDREHIATIAYKDLHTAVYLISAQAISRLIKKQALIHPETLACYNYYHKLANKALT